MTGTDALRRRPYEEKNKSLEEALGLIETGDHIVIGSACGEPQYLVNRLVEKTSHLADNETLHVHTLCVASYAKPIYSDRFRLNAFFVGINTREEGCDSEGWNEGSVTADQTFGRYDEPGSFSTCYRRTPLSEGIWVL